MTTPTTEDELCSKVNCPAGTVCEVKDSVTVCKVDGELTIPGGLRDTGSGTGYEDAKDCRPVRCGHGSCDNGSPDEYLRCVMWPPSAPIEFRKPICKFCWQVLQKDDVEMTNCYYDEPQCLLGGQLRGSGDGDGDVFTQSLGFYVFLGSLAVLCPICILVIIYFQCMRWQSRDHRRAAAKQWKPEMDLGLDTEDIENFKRHEVDMDWDNRWDHSDGVHLHSHEHDHDEEQDYRLHHRINGHHERIMETSHSARAKSEHSGRRSIGNSAESPKQLGDISNRQPRESSRQSPRNSGRSQSRSEGSPRRKSPGGGSPREVEPRLLGQLADPLAAAVLQEARRQEGKLGGESNLDEPMHVFMDIQVSAKAVAAVKAQPADQYPAFAPYKTDEEASNHSGNSRHSKHSNHSHHSHHSKHSGRVGHAKHVVEKKLHSGVAAASHVTHAGKNVVQKGVHSGVAVAGGAARAVVNKVHSGGGHHHHDHSNHEESNNTASRMADMKD